MLRLHRRHRVAVALGQIGALVRQADQSLRVRYTASKWAVHGLLFTARAQLNAQGIVLSEYAPGESNTPIVNKRPVLPTPEHRSAMIQTEDCAEALFFIASQAHSMSVIQLPAYQPFGGMPPQIPAPWLAGLNIGPAQAK